MKRRRGSKKGKAKKPRTVGPNEGVSIASQNTETNSSPEDIDNDGVDSGVEAETPSSTGTDQPQKPVSANSGGPSDNTGGLSVYGRVKVKIKTSKTLDSQHTSSEAPTHSDDKSSQQAGPGKQVVSGEKMEDSANSLPEASVGSLGNAPKKSGGIKIKSSRGFSSSMSPCNNAEVVKGEKTRKQEPEVLCRNSRFNKQELDTAMEIIRKVMKMEAAEPFNVPVDPVALGIPDYFDVIDTPMDFGTICRNLESGVKYMNAEHVYKDVQYIWGNCYKYNNKGDYVMELMKRVKKNFMKYWTAAGLYNDNLQGAESGQVKDATASSYGKEPTKGGHSNQKTKKIQGLKKHKEGCLCAICVMIRRRQEREESTQLSGDHMEPSDDYLEFKREETSPVESREYTSSNMENSPEPDLDASLQEKGVELDYSEDQDDPLHEKPEEEMEIDVGVPSKVEGEISEKLQSGYGSLDEHKGCHQKQNTEPGSDLLNGSRKETLQDGNEAVVTEKFKPKESLDKYQKAKILENLRYLENSRVVELSQSLFGDNQRSVWNGPHSLVKRREGLTHKSSIHDAISMLIQ